MIVHTVEFNNHSYGDVFSIYLMGDEHLGTIASVTKPIEKYVKQIKDDPLARVISMGDRGEYITPSDPRWDSGVVDPWLRQDNIADDIRDMYHNYYDPIGKKFIGMLWGNHERKFRKYSHNDVHKNLCKDFNTKSLGRTCYIIFKFKRKNSNSKRVFIGAFSHGAGSSATKSAKLNKLKNFMNIHPRADFYGYAHTHDCDLYPKVELNVDTTNGTLIHRNKIGLLTGCFFKTYCETDEATYGEEKEYEPLPIGCAVIRINPSEGTYKGEILI